MMYMLHIVKIIIKILGTVGSRYEPVQNTEAMDLYIKFVKVKW